MQLISWTLQTIVCDAHRVCAEQHGVKHHAAAPYCTAARQVRKGTSHMGVLGL